MSEPPPPPDPAPEEGPPSARSMVVVMVLSYTLMSLFAWAWLGLRDRSEIIPELAVGRHGELWAVGVGLGVALVISLLVELGRRYLRSVQDLESRLRANLPELRDGQIVGIALVSAVGEELFFRGAMQDALGPYLSALIFGLMHIRGGMLLWGVFALLMGLLFGLMVEFGFGLLSVSLAHALINYLSLRRMMDS